MTAKILASALVEQEANERDHWIVTVFSSERGRMEPPVLLNTSTVVVAESIHDRAMLGSPVTWSGM
ncbi:uncharacterized protein N7458_003786 [Penicillium daleae]|uniref:Uncharacterized protein n=1 Tax=Penicillium daleae TaxID=63821 RepID=A0AAD6CB93_9EURO|nr:uncharacterized protein N7458_003786 [Penicillium daleae]KAJ5455522.1 hypothetical protein N7458_003786 [Penicillium daleae]